MPKLKLETVAVFPINTPVRIVAAGGMSGDWYGAIALTGATTKKGGYSHTVIKALSPETGKLVQRQWRSDFLEVLPEGESIEGLERLKCAIAHSKDLACAVESVDLSKDSNLPGLTTGLKSSSSSKLQITLDESLNSITQASQSTTISAPLTQNADSSTLFLEDSLARISPLPEDKQELKERDQDYSENLSESFAWYDRDSSSWKTSQGCLLTGWESYSQSFPRRGTMRNGKLFHAPKWEESTSAIASGLSLIPTPKAQDGIHPGVQSHKQGQTLHLSAAVQKMPLPTTAGFFPTQGDRNEPASPTASDWKEKGFCGLPTFPPGTGGKSCGSQQSICPQTSRPRIPTNGGRSLSYEVQNLPTPTARDSRPGDATNRQGSPSLVDTLAPKGRKLNPNFVEKLMGFPPNWTEVEEPIISCDTPTSLNGCQEPQTAIISPTVENDSQPSEIVSSPQLPRSLGDESEPSQDSRLDKESDNWFTPQNILELVQQVLGEIDLDPCSNPQKSVPARRHYTFEDDGLKQEWAGSVFINPPYSCPGTWVAKLEAEYYAGRVRQAIALLPAATDTKWQSPILERSEQVICFWKGRIKFLDKDFNPKLPARQSHILIYYGNNQERFREVFEPYGVMVGGNNLIASVTSNKDCSNSNFGGLSESEERDRHRLETKVERAFYEAGSALREIRDRKLYRSTHETFEEYCKERFGFQRSHCYQLIDASGVVDNLSAIGGQILPTSERQVRPLTKLEPDEQRQVWTEAVDETGGKVPSGAIVKSVVQRIKERDNTPPTPEYGIGDVVEIRSSYGSSISKHNGCWGIVTHVGTWSYQVHISLRGEDIQCKGMELEKVDERYTAEIRAVSQRIKALRECSLDATEYLVLQAISKSICFTPKQMALLEFLESQYGLRSNK